MWVFSGRRGIHCWVCDPDTKVLKNEARSGKIHYTFIHKSYNRVLESHRERKIRIANKTKFIKKENAPRFEVIGII